MEIIIWQVAVLLICLALSAFFSATETAMTSISNLKAKHLQETQGRSAKVLNLWLKSPNRVLASILIGNNLVNIFASIWVENVVSEKIGKSYFLVVTAFMTFVIVIFAEIIPKTFGKNYAVKFAIPAMYVYQVIYFILYPVTYVVYSFSQAVTMFFKKKSSKKDPQITEEELEFLINVGEKEGILEEQKHDMLSGIFGLGDTVVREIMVHRTDITAIPKSTLILDAADYFKKTGYSRLPIYDEKVDNIVGFIHIKDVLFFLKENYRNPNHLQRTVLEIKHDVKFVPESKPYDDLFQEMRRNRTHMVIVLDEYGGTSGLVTMEDIFEEVVGEVRDEFDNEEDAVRPTDNPNKFLVDCKINIEDFCDFFDITLSDLLQEESNSEFDTLAGLILHALGQIPKIGDRLNLGKLAIEVIEIKRRRLKKVIVTREAPSLSQNHSNEEE